MGQLLTYSPLAALIAGGNWNNGAQCGARAVNCNNYPWNVNTNTGARGACDSVRALQAQCFTKCWQGLLIKQMLNIL